MFSVIYDQSETRHAPQFYIKNGQLGVSLDHPKRAETLLSAFRTAEIEIRAATNFGLGPVLNVHTQRYLQFLQRADEYLESSMPASSELVPTITRKGNASVYPDSLIGQLEWHMFDTYSPISHGTMSAALGAANCAITAAHILKSGGPASYALCRPPGHHAHADYGGGYCYFNNAAVAAEFLAKGGKRVAILDLDADHGNGTQSIFYERPDVLHVSIHADPTFSYPFFTGHEVEIGWGEGIGTTRNIPLRIGTADQEYLDALEVALEHIARFDPEYLVVALGVDGHIEEPNPLFALSHDCYSRIGEAIASLNRPTMFTQEGGYNLKNLAANVLATISPFIARSEFTTFTTRKGNANV
ncbi:histone deacetylase family protein [Mesorhizobium sp. Cs1299R1N3]|uniref:histone deacetylase family protein n=1 Tax=Mesorhizobium sp. Cs1299R1N3 TaxID=3015173 RepID=UPI00301E494E